MRFLLVASLLFAICAPTALEADKGPTAAPINCLESVWESRPRSDRQFDLLNDRSGQDAISCSTLTTPSAFEQMLETMRLAAQRKDRRTLVNLIAYPLTFVNKSGVVTILNKGQALRSQNLIFTDEVLEAMQRLQLRQMRAVMSKGGGFVSGAIWLGSPPVGGDPKILTINLRALNEHKRRGLSERTYGLRSPSDKAVDTNPISAKHRPPRHRAGPQE